MARDARLVQTRPTGNQRSRGLVSSRTSGRRIDVEIYEPPNDLADVVEKLWVGRWDLRGQAPHTTELLSDPCVHIVFERGDRIDARVVGVWTRLWTNELSGRGEVHAAKLRAGGARAFLRGSAHELTNRRVAIDAAFGEEAAAIGRRMTAAEAPLSVMQDVLRAHRRPRGDERRAIELVERIVREADVTSVALLAEREGTSVRELQRLFKENVGAPPKWVIRRHRLQEVALRLERNEPVSIAALAADLGYTDQAHLTRDFSAAVGRPPRAFREAMSAELGETD